MAAAVRAAAGDASFDDSTALLTPSRNPKFGDFQCNAPMPLGKAQGKPPRDIATVISDRLASDAAFTAIAEPPEIAGPGFINIRLRAPALGAALETLERTNLGITPPAPAETETVVVDLCGVNLAKQMHVGHLRATVIGDCLARLWERLGHKVIRQNHFGDWGLPIAMVTQAVKDRVDRGELDLDRLDLDHLEALYRAAQRDCDADDKGLAAVHKYGLGPKAHAELEAQVSGAREAEARAKAALVALQRHDPAYYKIWQAQARITLRAVFHECARLHANVTDAATAGESTYSEELGPLVEDVLMRGVAEVSDGAAVIRLDEFGIKEPLIIRKRDGGFLYGTTDIAGIRRRVQKLGGTRLLYAVDARQSLHFKQAFAGARKAGFTKTRRGEDATIIHAAFGTVLGEDGTPFKTRSGENVRLADLIDEAIERADKAVREKNPDLPADERRRVAQAIGVSAIKYADLSSDRIKDYVFSFDRMLAFEGNTGPYLLYALVRIRSIFRKAIETLGVSEAALEKEIAAAPFDLAEPQEKTLALALLRFPRAIRGAAETCEPHRLCGYLFELATAFSAFFTECPVIQAPTPAKRASRLRLCRLTGRVLEDGLTALGLVPLERM